MQDLTTEDLILYLYRESDPALTSRIDKALEEQWAVREKLNVLKASIQHLNNSTPLTPSRATLDAIMAHARKSKKVSH